MKKGPITIKDIASELNISPSTVSRALADNPLVKTSTREAVKALASKYKYEPNYTALSLRSSKTKTIGVIIPQLVHEFFSLVIRGIEDYAYTSGYNVIICSTHEDYDREVIDARALLTGKVDGVLACITHRTEDFAHFVAFQDRKVPLGFFDCICDAIESHKVVIDDEHAGYVATKHLIDQGSRTIAYIGGPISLAINKARFRGYKNAIAEAGLKVDDGLVLHCGSGDLEDGMRSSEMLLESRKFDGLFAGTDMLAIGAMKNIKKRGLTIPQDVAIVGFSDWTISALYEPSLTTIHQPGYEMGYTAARLLVDQIEHPENVKYITEVLKTELVIRESSQRQSMES